MENLSLVLHFGVTFVRRKLENMSLIGLCLSHLVVSLNILQGTAALTG